ncbi:MULTISPECIES: hypothetical protein [Actinomycetes]|uniref:Allantoin permease n=2 Tax=Actinomycetes TaxID=1760 RepID=A0ABP6M5W1_9MICC
MTAAERARRAAEDSLEDYAFRYVPRSFRRWSTLAVGGTALGSIAFLADFSIGASIGMEHGTLNALLGILLASVIIFLVGLPISVYAARYNLDIDLLTRGCGFGYRGSVITTLIFAGFTCLFFALEGAIMAQALHVGLGVALPVGYLLSTLVVIPIVFFGMRALERLQRWTTPLWLVLALVPLVWVVLTDPDVVESFLAFDGAGEGVVELGAVVACAAVCFALAPQLAEQLDYLRFMPPRTRANRGRWWASVLLAGPGWVAFSGAKQMIGVFLAVYVLARVDPTLGGRAAEPVVQILGLYERLMPDWLAVVLAMTLVVVAQVKINVTNGYSGSLACLNACTRLTRRYPGRTPFVLVNLSAAYGLMVMDVFALMSFVLSLYANVVMAWLVTVAVDIAVNKRLLGISPVVPEHRRGMLHDWNPVGLVSVGAASLLSLLTFFGVFGEALRPFAVGVAILVAAVVTPTVAALTRGQWYLRRRWDGIDLPLIDDQGSPSAARLRCHVTGYTFERPDMLASAEPGPFGETQHISSLALTLADADRYVLPADGGSATAAPPWETRGTPQMVDRQARGGAVMR